MQRATFAGLALALASGAAASGAWPWPHAFPCAAVAPAKAQPADIHELHPGHVSVVMAMGDSITAAFGARGEASSRRALPLEYRADSFSIGEGSGQHWTLPYFLRHYNVSLAGFSSHSTILQMPEMGYLEPDVDFMNVALSGARTPDLMRELGQLLIQANRIPSFPEQWKVLTILIGANDVCDIPSCNGDPADAQEVVKKVEKKMTDLLGAIQGGLTRVYVNVLALPSIASVRRATAAHKGILPCHLEARLVDECDCIDTSADGSGKITEEQLQRLDRTTVRVNKKLEEVAARFNGKRSDFAVVMHDAWANQGVPNFDFLSDLDCFHPSALAHRTLAIDLWNSMLAKTPPPPAPWNASVVPVCPGADSVFRTGAPRPATGEAPILV